ncbi:unnamed protein product [Lactuca virosa]|uniref:Retrotransposon gag domain-containing protein n=1 Tax=Lactuca virosa TaxID=75947 RepID=A0AAU9PGN6_9ASTR|nr:unnamed protein product [Lactuca virosa]
MTNNTTKISALEATVSKLGEDFEATRKENAQQFSDILKAIGNLTTTLEGQKSNKGPAFEFGSFNSDDDASGWKPPKNNDRNKGAGRLGWEFRKLKAPIFEGEDVYGWIYRVERFFEVQGIDEKDQLRAATICLDGSTLLWYRWNEARTPCATWADLKQQLLERFQPSQEGSLYEQFLTIQQEGTARDYVCLFERLAGQLTDIPEKVLEGSFIKGLKPELRSTVRIMEPESLARAMRIAIMLDDNKATGGAKTGGGTNPQ